MRRHLRNHTSPNRPLNTSSPYTYPLTTVPRPLYTMSTSAASVAATQGTQVGCSPPLRHAAPSPYSRNSDTASDEDELSESEYASTRSHWDAQLEETRSAVGRLRLRGYSTSSVPLSRHSHSAAGSPMLGRRHLQQDGVRGRQRSSSYTVPGCRNCAA